MPCPALSQRYEHTGDRADIAEAIAAAAEATRVCEEYDTARGRFLHNHSIAVHSLYQHSGDSPLLREALLLARTAVTATSDSDPELGGLLSPHRPCP